MRANVGDLISYTFGDVIITGIVLQAIKTTHGMWGTSSKPEFTVKLLELDGHVSVWDVWPDDVIVIHDEARRPCQD